MKMLPLPNRYKEVFQKNHRIYGRGKSGKQGLIYLVLNKNFKHAWTRGAKYIDFKTTLNKDLIK